MGKFNVGDCVVIISPEEYKKRGGCFSQDCAFVYYSGEVCEITGIRDDNDCAYYIRPLDTQKTNNHPDHIWPITSYMWYEDQLSPYEDPRGHVDTKDFCDIFR